MRGDSHEGARSVVIPLRGLVLVPAQANGTTQAGPFSPMGGGPFLAFEAAGDYPIHIIVKHGHITLLGVMDSESDKTLAGMRAREVPGAFGVDNQLIVEKSTDTTKR